MATRIRLQRHGRSKRPYYYIVVADSRTKRDGKFIDRLGDYNPLTNPATINLNFDKAFDWVMNGAEPSETVKKILSYKGVLYKKHLARGLRKGALTEEQVESKMQEWLNEKETKISSKVTKLQDDKKSKALLKLEEETKKREAYQEKLNAQTNPETETTTEETAQIEDVATEETAQTEDVATEETTKTEE